MKTVLVYILALVLTGCGAADRVKANWTGQGSKVCVDGVVYLQFTSGTSVAYTREGKIKTCND